MEILKVVKNFLKITGIAGLLMVWLSISGCNDAAPSSSSGGGGQNERLSGSLYYYEGRYGKDMLNAYVKLNLTNLASAILNTDRGWHYSIAQDKSRILVVDPSRTIINIYDNSGILIRALDFGYTIVGVPRYSYDRKHIAVQFNNNYAHKYLAILTSNGEALNVVNIQENERSRDGVRGVDWTPDGQIVYSAYGKIYRIPNIEADDVELIKSFESEFDVFSVRVSPDGKKLAFLADDSYVTTVEGDLYTMNIDGSDVQQITQTGIVYTFNYPAWAPDSRHLAAHFAPYSGNADCGNIWIFDTEIDQVVHIDKETSAAEIEGGFKIDTADYEVHGLCTGEGLDWY